MHENIKMKIKFFESSAAGKIKVKLSFGKLILNKFFFFFQRCLLLVKINDLLITFPLKKICFSSLNSCSTYVENMTGSNELFDVFTVILMLQIIKSKFNNANC